MDFTKAFDKAPHYRLLLKLAGHGFSSKIKDWKHWIVEWLRGRKKKGLFERDSFGLADSPQ